MSFVVYSDGSGTTLGPAGIGFVAYTDGLMYGEGSLPVDRATNQQAEILAAAFALHSIPADEDVTVVTDSEYVVNGYRSLPVWQSNGWRRTSGGHVKNVPHWQRLFGAAQRHRSVEFRWTKGHAGTEGNERADRLAGAARLVAKQRLAVAA